MDEVGERGEEFKGLTTVECRSFSAEEVKGTGATGGEKDIQHAVAHCYKCGLKKGGLSM